jgi:hypothetical protein
MVRVGTTPSERQGSCVFRASIGFVESLLFAFMTWEVMPPCFRFSMKFWQSRCRRHPQGKFGGCCSLIPDGSIKGSFNLMM